jgi:hypothetical protein
MDFFDVGENNWFYAYVAWAYDAGIVAGYEDGTFRPNAPISRAELAAMVARAAELDLADEAGDLAFTDAEDIQGWALEYVYAVYSEGWMTGDAAGTFRPRANITRAETAAVFNRVLARGATTAESIEDVLDDVRFFPDVAEGRWYYFYVVEATNSHYYTIVDGVEIWTSVVTPAAPAAKQASLTLSV